MTFLEEEQIVLLNSPPPPIPPALPFNKALMRPWIYFISLMEMLRANSGFNENIGFLCWVL